MCGPGPQLFSRFLGCHAFLRMLFPQDGGQRGKSQPGSLCASVGVAMGAGWEQSILEQVEDILEEAHSQH